jgi:peroxiredoxin
VRDSNSSQAEMPGFIYQNKYRNMKVIFLNIFVLLVLYRVQLNAQTEKNLNNSKIIVEGQLPPDYNSKMPANRTGVASDSVELSWIVYDYITVLSAPNKPEIPGERGILKAKISNGTVKFVIQSKKPLLLMSPFFDYTKFINPGDSIYIRYNGEQPIYSGKGADGFKLQFEIMALKKVKKPNFIGVDTLANYFMQSKWYDKQLNLIIPLIESYKNKITPLAYQTIKTTEIVLIEQARNQLFDRLYTFWYNRYERKPGVTSPIMGLKLSDLNAIWDSTQRNTNWGKWLRSLSTYNTSPDYLYTYNKNEVRRRFSFDFSRDTLYNDRLRKLAYYNNAKANFRGQVRERLLIRILAEEIITELTPIDEITKSVLQDYYKQAGFAAYKQWIKAYYNKAMQLKSGNPAPDFTLTDTDGRAITKQDVKGKCVLLDFWFTGCRGCLQMAPALKKVEQIFSNDSNVIFISVSTDRNKETWIKSINEGKYTSGSALNVYTSGKGTSHDIIKNYGITGYPGLFLLDEEGNIIEHPLPDPRTEVGTEKLVSLLKRQSAKISRSKVANGHDGPYVLYTDTADMVVKYIESRKESLQLREEKRKANEKNKLVFPVSTDQPGKQFQVKLRTELSNEPAIFFQPAKQFVISDIEGNFDALRNLLQSGKVIDEQFNWTFGNGHLICVGDFCDRGEQVTECLWLIYSLEEKAKSAGGYVHFILGNHEIMNLSGDVRYVADKYKANAKLAGVKYIDLYGEQSELGRWLRTKNIIEKIGDILYVHGGISPVVNRLSLTIEEINHLVRPYYKGRLDSSNKALLTLYSSATTYNEYNQSSPFWYRGYYEKSTTHLNAIPSREQVDSTLKKFAVNHIITGHTIVADTVSTHYNGVVLNVDTHHAYGKSEALLIEGGKYYRVSGVIKKELFVNTTGKYYAAREHLND